MALTDDQLLELVWRRMEPLARGEKMESFEQIRKDHPFSKFSSVTLGEEFVRAFKEGRVDFRVKIRNEPNRPHKALEQRLEDAFEVSDAIIIERGNENSLPARLGLSCARYLNDDRLTNDENMAVGAGQTIGWLSRYVREQGGIRQQGITFLSLTGAFCARQRAEHGPSKPNPSKFEAWLYADVGSDVLIDADVNAMRMAQGFSSHVRFKLIGAPAVTSIGESRDSVLRNTWLGVALKDRPKLNRALVGVGVLHKNWQVDPLNARGTGRASDANRAFAADLNKLRKICVSGQQRSNKGHTWWPVFDVANFLMLTEPRDECHLDQKSEDEARKLVDTLNKQLVTATDEDLVATPLMAVAGGERKVYALYDTLRKFRVEYLFTDDATAEALLEIRAGEARQPTTPAAPNRTASVGTRRKTRPKASARA